MKKWKILSLFLLFCIQASCQAMYDFGENPSIVSTQSGMISIEPATLLQDIKKQKAGLFVPIENEPDFRSAPNIPSVQWGQKDFLEIAKAVYMEVWNEPLDGWSVQDIYFLEECSDMHVGLQHATFKLFKNTDPKGNNRGEITKRLIVIRPKYKFILWSEEVISMNSGKERFYSILDFLVTAEHALWEADENGGKLVRQDVEDKCYIKIYPIKLENSDTWKVEYYSRESSSYDPDFEFTVQRNK